MGGVESGCSSRGRVCCQEECRTNDDPDLPATTIDIDDEKTLLKVAEAEHVLLNHVRSQRVTGVSSSRNMWCQPEYPADLPATIIDHDNAKGSSDYANVEHASSNRVAPQWASGCFSSTDMHTLHQQESQTHDDLELPVRIIDIDDVKILSDLTKAEHVSSNRVPPQRGDVVAGFAIRFRREGIDESHLALKATIGNITINRNFTLPSPRSS